MRALLQNKIIGGLSDKYQIYTFFEYTSNSKYGGINQPNINNVPKGIRSVIALLTKAVETRINYEVVHSDEYYYTAWISLRLIEAPLKQFLARLSYVLMYPHRIVLDRIVLETVLKREGMDNVINYLQSAEQHFNEKKYIEFCAMSRNALEEVVKTICLVLDGAEHGYPNNIKRLEQMNYIRGTIAKQAKEFGGSLSSCGSHPPQETLSIDEAKFLLDSLYSFLGLFALRLSNFKKLK